MKVNKKKFSQNQYKKNNDFDDDDYQETPKWYEENVNEPNNADSVTEQVLIELKDEAKRCHDAEINNYNISK